MRKGASAEGRADPLKIRCRGSSRSTPALCLIISGKRISRRGKLFPAKRYSLAVPYLNYGRLRSVFPRETREYVRIITGNNAENRLEESRTLSLHLELPRGAPCEGVGGLSKAKEVAAIPVALAPSISDAIRKAEAEARRASAAKLEAAAKAKTRLALLLNKKSLKEPASSRAVRKLAALQFTAGRPRRPVHTALAKRPVHSRTKAAQRSRQVDET